MEKGAMEKMKLVVLGAGPAGIATAVEATLAGIRPVVVLEKEDYICHTIEGLYRPGKLVERTFRQTAIEPVGHLSFETEGKEEFLARMTRLIAAHDLDIRFRVNGQVDVNNDLFIIPAGEGCTIAAPLLVAAIGVFGRPARPSYNIPREIRDRVFAGLPPPTVRDKEILVIGGGDSAAEAACFLSETNRVTISYRRPQFFRLTERNLCSVRGCCDYGKIRLKLPSDVVALTLAGGRIRVHYQDGTEELHDLVSYFLGGSTPRAFLQAIGVEYADNRPIVDAYGETNIPRLFLVGDLVANKGTIMAAFNSAARTIEGILLRYGGI